MDRDPRCGRRKSAAGGLGFDDMLNRLDESCAATAATLAAIRQRFFPVAMIDEFQDIFSDPQQYRIFAASGAGSRRRLCC